MHDCIFCKIVAGEIPAEKLYEDEEVLAFRDSTPQAPVHFLVIPKKHIAGPAAMVEADDRLVGKLLRVGAQVAAENDIGDAYRTICNNGSKVGQVVFHLHLHILGGKDRPWPL